MNTSAYEKMVCRIGMFYYFLQFDTNRTKVVKKIIAHLFEH